MYSTHVIPLKFQFRVQIKKGKWKREWKQYKVVSWEWRIRWPEETLSCQKREYDHRKKLYLTVKVSRIFLAFFFRCSGRFGRVGRLKFQMGWIVDWSFCFSIRPCFYLFIINDDRNNLDRAKCVMGEEKERV